MKYSRNYLNIDNPNIQPSANPSVPMGELVTVYSSVDSETETAGNVVLRDLHLPQVSVRTMEGQFQYDAVFDNLQNEGSHLIASCFIIEGNITSTLRSNNLSSPDFAIRSGQQTLKFDPHNELVHRSAKNTPFRIAHFSFEQQFIFNLLPEDESWSASLRERIISQQRVFGNLPPTITAAQQLAMHNILNNPFKGKLGLLMMETSVVQLMLYQLQAQFSKMSATPPGVSSRDMEIIHAVRDYLLQTFLQNHSLVELARQFATNTNKLMTLFRKVFHTSIFEYISDLKMDHALRLLLEEGRYVSEVSGELGYKNPHHFTAAFKKKHGFCPSRLKGVS